MRTHLTCSVLAGLALALASQAQAATVTGTINSTLTLIAACQVNGSAGTSGSTSVTSTSVLRTPCSVPPMPRSWARVAAP